MMARQKKPGGTVKLNGKTLKNGTDYMFPIQTTSRSEQQRSLSQARAITSAQFQDLRSIKKITSRKPAWASRASYLARTSTQSITVKYKWQKLKEWH